MKKSEQPLKFILELLVLAKKQEDWNKVTMATNALLNYMKTSTRSGKRMRRKLELEQIQNHHMQNQIKDIERNNE